MILIRGEKKKEWVKYKGDITVVTRLKIIYIQYFIMSVPVHKQHGQPVRRSHWWPGSGRCATHQRVSNFVEFLCLHGLIKFIVIHVI